MRLRFYKSTPSWRSTIYVLGSPRSGKSTVLNLLNSCRNVEAVDEPFELTVMAQKGGLHSQGSAAREEYVDSYMASLENYFSELVLGRRYNFRSCDKSSIFNVKSDEEIAEAHARLRRVDALDYAASVHATFAIAMNDVEASLDLLLRDVPNPTVVWVRRDIDLLAKEIAEKGWLSDQQLETQAHVSPAYVETIMRAGRKIYLPYFVREGEGDIFLGMDELARAKLYCDRQEEVMQKGLAELGARVVRLEFQDLVSLPPSKFDAVLRRLKLVGTDKTRALLSELATRR